MRVARIAAPIVTLGPGRRCVVWLQGCDIGCRGCMSKHTWDAGGGELVPVDDLLAQVLEARDTWSLSGLTVSGGEPFQQPEALRRLLEGVRRDWSDADVLVFSGHQFDRLVDRHAALLRLCDAVIAGPFVSDQPSTHPWVGSSNQQLVVLNEELSARYEPSAAEARQLQVSVDDQSVWITGVPRPGDLERLHHELETVGLSAGGVSW